MPAILLLGWRKRSLSARATAAEQFGGSLGDDRRQHLEFIQAVIARQAANSFFIKGWCLTVAIAVYGLALNKPSPMIAVLGAGGVLIFWGLDAYFLRQERMYRCLYRKAVEVKVAVYDMNAQSYREEGRAGWLQVGFSRTLLPLYGAVLLAGVAVAYIAGGITPDGPSIVPI